MHLPLLSVALHATLTYLVGFCLMMLAMPLLGFVAGVVAIMQRLGLKDSVMGDDNWQIVIDFAMGLVGVLLLLGVFRWFRRPLWRLIGRDLRLLRLIARTVARPFQKRRSKTMTPHTAS